MAPRQAAASASESRLTVSVIVPVRKGRDYLRRCLSSLAAAAPPPLELVVVVDGTTEPGWEQAARKANALVVHTTPEGPAHARNTGVRQTTSDLLFFVDADVAVPPDVVERVAAVFEEDPGLAAAFGSYDDEPAEPNFLSQYKNLLHHYIHQTSPEEAYTFWTGCGIIRREIFDEVGGFDEAYRIPCVEDMELGNRVRRAGHRIRLLKTLQVKHLKRWTLYTLLRAEIFRRALPWTELLLEEGKIPDTLNIRVSSRVSTALVGLGLGSLAAAPLCPALLVPAGGCAAALLILNRDLYRFFARKRGLPFALVCIPWHWFYFLYSGLSFGAGFAKFQLDRWRR